MIPIQLLASFLLCSSPNFQNLIDKIDQNLQELCSADRSTQAQLQHRVEAGETQTR